MLRWSPSVFAVLLSLCLIQCAYSGDVKTGIDVLVGNGFEQLAGARVGLISNHTGVARDGRSTIRLLHQAPNVTLVRIFSPEHGIEGTLDIPMINDDDSTTGIGIVSLYGETRRPTAEMLAGIDTLVFDIQDIGTRFYTYVSTMGYAMQAAAEQGIRFVVLDRPNPINGVTVTGPVLDEGKRSFVGFYRLPIRHGMTVGELARMFRDELKLDLELDIVAMQDWARADFFDTTGLRWINPSPNMRSLTAAVLYPGIGLLETTNLSVGRGTERPFEFIGAPWLDGPSFVRKLNALELPGVTFVPIRFEPTASTFANEMCLGARIVVTDRDAFEPVATGLSIARMLAMDYPKVWASDDYLRLLGHSRTLQLLQSGAEVSDIRLAYHADLERFRQRRAKFLLYE